MLDQTRKTPLLSQHHDEGTPICIAALENYPYLAYLQKKIWLRHPYPTPPSYRNFWSGEGTLLSSLRKLTLMLLHPQQPCSLNPQAISSTMHNIRDAAAIHSALRSVPGTERKPLAFPLCVQAMAILGHNLPYGPDYFWEAAGSFALRCIAFSSAFAAFNQWQIAATPTLC